MFKKKRKSTQEDAETPVGESTPSSEVPVLKKHKTTGQRIAKVEEQINQKFDTLVETVNKLVETIKALDTQSDKTKSCVQGTDPYNDVEQFLNNERGRPVKVESDDKGEEEYNDLIDDLEMDDAEPVKVLDQIASKFLK